jgi:hypothetical protein
MVFFGMIFMAFILFSPNGIMGIIQNIVGHFRREEETKANTQAVSPGPVSPNPRSNGNETAGNRN